MSEKSNKVCSMARLRKDLIKVGWEPEWNDLVSDYNRMIVDINHQDCSCRSVDGWGKPVPFVLELLQELCNLHPVLQHKTFLLFLRHQIGVGCLVLQPIAPQE